jgi:SAM-dependent methyltransferase
LRRLRQVGVQFFRRNEDVVVTNFGVRICAACLQVYTMQTGRSGNNHADFIGYVRPITHGLRIDFRFAIMNLKGAVKRLLPPLLLDAFKYARGKLSDPDAATLNAFEKRGRIPWSTGYNIYKAQLIQRTMAEPDLIELFRSGAPLPPGFGRGVDERCIEYPWAMTRLAGISGRILDAGSALNHSHILNQRVFERNKLHILTLAPESTCFWQKGFSYIYDDLRDIPTRNNYYDAIVCLSTLEHIGCDNRRYSHTDVGSETNLDDFRIVMREFRRVLKPSGCLLFTVPFGVYRNFGCFQQFDRTTLSSALDHFGVAASTIQCFYRYTPDGWQVVSDDECSQCEYVGWVADAWLQGKFPFPIPAEPDLAAAARSVACVELIKPRAA